MLEPDGDIKSLLQENLTLTREVHRTMRSVRRYILWGRVVDTVKFLFVVGALAGTYFFLQPYLMQALGFYRELLGGYNQSETPGSGDGAPINRREGSPFDFEKLLQGLENPR